jgi:hypothetical protein
MTTLARLIASATLALGVIALAGCGGGGSMSDGNGMITVSLTDAPVDNAAAVVIVFNGIELQRANGERVNIDFDRKSIDLLQLQNGITGDLTKDAAVPAGDYQWMRLKVLATQNSQDESHIRLEDGTQFPLWIPSGAETGLKLIHAFTVGQGSTTRLVIDFNLRKSVIAPPGQAPNYMLKPVLRLIDHLQVGQITANVDLAALTAAQLAPGAAVADCKASLYLFAGAMAVPDDQDGDAMDGADPIVYQMLTFDGVNTVVTVNLPFVEVGDYTLAATCNGDIDVADTNDYNPSAVSGDPGFQTMMWSTVNNVAVALNATTTVPVP